LEGVRGASFFRIAEAAEVALAALNFPRDYYLDYTLKETLRQLEPLWRKALGEGRLLAADNPAGQAFLVRSLKTAELQNLPRTAAVLEELVTRAGLTDSDRSLALLDLAKDRKVNRGPLLLDLLERAPASEARAMASGLARLLPLQLPEDLKGVRARIARMATEGPRELRAFAWAALAAADETFDGVWSTASASPAALTDLLNGIPQLNDPEFRSKAFQRVRPLVGKPETATGGVAPRSAGGQFVRIELPQRGTLTLAEVEVFVDGANIAGRGKARQSSTSNDGAAARAIDGRTDGSFASGTQTHTTENDRNPWWEVDLGGEFPIEAVTVWNRTEGDLGRRLEGFALVVLDGGRTEVYRKAGNAAPSREVRLPVSPDPAGALRRAAMRALVSMGTEPAATFAELAALIGRGQDVAAAAQAIRVLPQASWPKDQAGATTRALVGWAKSVPAADRTREDYVQALQTAGDLAGLMPADQAAVARRELKELRVSVFVIRTVREQMRYDTPRLVVEAGKPFEVIIENDDFMPHNLVVVKPGGREKVGPLADRMQPDQLDGQGRAFVPGSPEILGATRLLEAGMKATLKLTAPDTEGVYEYVCTFPGHWPVMWGRLIVTRDVDAYLQQNPMAEAVGAPADHGHE
jgi:azurin